MLDNTKDAPCAPPSDARRAPFPPLKSVGILRHRTKDTRTRRSAGDAEVLLLGDSFSIESFGGSGEALGAAGPGEKNKALCGKSLAKEKKLWF